MDQCENKPVALQLVGAHSTLNPGKGFDVGLNNAAHKWPEPREDGWREAEGSEATQRN